MSVWRLVRNPVRTHGVFSSVLSSRLSNTRCVATNDRDAPVKFSQSPASGWKAAWSREGVNKTEEFAWFQPYVILTSMSALLVYFCFLREENDLDEILSVTLYERIDGLEKVQLEASLEYNLDHNLPTDSIKKRLKELEKEDELRSKYKNKL